ncbi:MAG: hypothetical protein LAO19_14700 [Acidobacteriia bacterium]|nr:hypothetical protein [Terriglobia bacterium]
MDKIELKDRLDLTARVGAIALIALYGAGYLVVSIHNAWYGIVEFGLFRTRLISAGIVFAIFFAIPFLETCKIYGLFWIEPWKSKSFGQETVFASSPFWRWSSKLFSFFVATWAISFVLRSLLVNYDAESQISRWSYVAFVVPIVVSIGVGWGILRNKIIGIIFTILAFVSIALSVIGLIRSKEFVFVALIVWFASVGWFTHEIHDPIREPAKLRDVRWDIVVVNIVSVFTIFGAWIYPKIHSEFGGGRPSPVVLQFVGTSPIDSSVKMDVWLVDETDSGYYFVQKVEDRKAIFVPRSLISAVYFQSDKSP